MRSSVLFLLFALLIALPITAHAAGGFVIGAHGGVTVPSGSFGDYWDTGFLVGGYGEYMVSEPFAIGVDVNYAENNPSDQLGIPSDADATFSYLNVGAHGKWTYLAMGSPLRPYLVGGGGLYSVKYKYEDPTTSTEEKRSEFGLMGGIGLSWLATTSIRLEMEANYHHVFTSESDFGDSSAPFFGVQGGIAYAFGQKSAE
jgi:Outer membrane protein beta-barrel domain